MAALGTVALIAAAAGTAVSAVGTIASGRAQKKIAEFQAGQMEIQGKQEFAEAQREAQEIRRNKELVLSQQQARAAASGLGPSDPTVVELAQEVAGFGTEQEQRALTAGTIRRRNLDMQAAATRATGQANYTGSLYDAGGTLLSGFANAFQMKYGNGGFRPASASTSYGASGAWYG